MERRGHTGPRPHSYASDGVYDVVHTAVDDEGRERTVREQVEAVACLENQGQEVTVDEGLASPLALIANVGGVGSAHVTFTIDLLDATGDVVGDLRCRWVVIAIGV